MKIAYLDPVPAEAAVPVFLEELSKFAGTSTEVSYHTLSAGADNYEYEVYEAYMLPKILDKIRSLEKENYDGVILGCFYDPAIEAAKEMAEKIVVVGAAQAAVHLACLLSKRFSLMIPRDKNYTHMKEMIHRYGAGEKLASVRVLNIKVLDLQNSHNTDQRMEEELRSAISDDHAEAMVLACTMETGKFAQLQEKYGIPVIDPAVAALKLAEHLCECKRACNWYTSKVGTYESPPEEEWNAFQF